MQDAKVDQGSFETALVLSGDWTLLKFEDAILIQVKAIKKCFPNIRYIALHHQVEPDNHIYPCCWATTERSIKIIKRTRSVEELLLFRSGDLNRWTTFICGIIIY